MNFLKHPDLHLLRWNTDFINYLNSKPPAVQYMKELKVTRGGIYGFPKFTNTEVVVKFWVADENRYITLRLSMHGLRIINKKGISRVVKELRAKGTKL